MYILGVSALDKDSSLTLFKDNQLLYAVTEERLTRRKQQDGFPWKAFEEMLSYNNISPNNIDVVAYPFFTAFQELSCASKSIPKIAFQILTNKGLNLSEKLTSLYDYIPSLRGNYQVHNFCDQELAKGLKYFGLGDRLRRFDHELCHAAAAYYSSGFNESLIQISDWYGSGSSGGIFLGVGNEITQLVKYIWPNSMGSYYARFTEALGFKTDRHEGKVLGLAAYGDASHLYRDFLQEFTVFDDGTFFHSRCLINDSKKICSRHQVEDVASALQQVFETVLLSSLTTQTRRTGIKRVCLAGGSMANVKLNQRIYELPEIDEVFVFPAMADIGSGYGAACLAMMELGLSPKHIIDKLYLSRNYEDHEVKTAILKSGYAFTFIEDIEVTIAGLLAENQIVARWNGKMEFGPRALGNRSILANPSRRDVVDIINKRLQRSDFMPFAPSFTEETAFRLFPNIAGARQSAHYMTMTFDMPPDIAELIPAAVHVDKTARLQIVSKHNNPSFHKIIDSFEKRTGIPGIINTSFNMHEEPIVYSPDDALRGFRDSQLDYLAMGNYLISSQKEMRL